MKTLILAAIIAASASVAASASFAEPMQNVASYSAPTAKRVAVPLTVEQVNAIKSMIAPVCAKSDKIVLSKAAIKACAGDEKQFPKLTKKGDKLTKGKTGAEFSTLLANLAAFN